jgi:hypothetical protein
VSRGLHEYERWEKVTLGKDVPKIRPRMPIGLSRAKQKQLQECAAASALLLSSATVLSSLPADSTCLPQAVELMAVLSSANTSA